MQRLRLIVAEYAASAVERLDEEQFCFGNLFLVIQQVAKATDRGESVRVLVAQLLAPAFNCLAIEFLRQLVLAELAGVLGKG